MTTKEDFFSRKDRAAQALQAAQILLPSSSTASPVDNSVQAIFERLKLSSRTDFIEAEQSIDTIDSHPTEDETIHKQDLLRKTAERGLDLLEIIQDWLVLEVDKADTGSSSTDCKHQSPDSWYLLMRLCIVLLSIQQRALVQRMTQHVVAFLLLPTLQELCKYVVKGQPMKAEVPEFNAFIEPFQRILRLSVPISTRSVNQTASKTAASSRLPPQHITYVTQTFRNTTTLVHLLAASILVGWYEAVARDSTAPLYRLTRDFLHTLGGRTETISVLGGVIRLTAPASAKVASRDSRGPITGAASTERVNVRWPPYVMAVARAMMARQITMPLGVMGLMNCVFGSDLTRAEGTSPIDLRSCC